MDEEEEEEEEEEEFPLLHVSAPYYQREPEQRKDHLCARSAA